MEIRRYLTWMTQYVSDQSYKDTGIGIVVKGNKAVYEYIWEGTIEGARISAPGICVYEFRDEKLQYHKAVLDRLSMAQQGAKGWLAKRVVNSVLKQAEKGLR